MASIAVPGIFTPQVVNERQSGGWRCLEQPAGRSCPVPWEQNL